MKISAMTSSELDSVRGLWEGLNAHHLSKSTHFKEHFSTFTFQKRIEGLKKKDRLAAFAAEDSGEKVGYCIATVHDRIGEIDSLFVSERYRGKGLGKELMSLAMEWLKGETCDAVMVAVAEGNEDVLDFYRQFGFAERLIVMQKRM
jgi:ribosomal protein S18 acetylase RimI-like enzyme